MAIVPNLALTSPPTGGNVKYSDAVVDGHYSNYSTDGITPVVVGVPVVTDDRGNPDTTTVFFDGVVFAFDIPDLIAVVGEEFIYHTAQHFTSDGDSPLIYTSTLLNDGLVIDADTGIISGIPTALGANNPIVTCTNADGTADSNTFEILAVT